MKNDEKILIDEYGLVKEEALGDIKTLEDLNDLTFGLSDDGKALAEGVAV